MIIVLFSIYFLWKNAKNKCVGTFILTDEPEDEPPILLKQELAKKSIPEEQWVVER